MRIEKVGANQIKFVLMMDDLRERDIKISDLSYASDKTQKLFREIMRLVEDEQDFFPENTPLMFEAMRVGVDSVVVLVTKVPDGMSQMPDGFVCDDDCEEFSLSLPIRRSGSMELEDLIAAVEEADAPSYSVFSFNAIDTLAAAARRLTSGFAGSSEVIKMDSKYFLVLQNETPGLQTTKDMEAILSEFGQKHVSNSISHYYLLERGEVFYANDALKKLRRYSKHMVKG